MALRDTSSEDFRPKPAPPVKKDVLPHTSHNIAMAGGIIMSICVTIFIFSDSARWLAVGILFFIVFSVGAYARFMLDKNNAIAQRQKSVAPPGGWKGRGDGPSR